MNPIKIIFFDVDGTLLDHSTGCISEKNLEMLARLHENGIRVCIATGRSPVALPDFGQVQIDAFCTNNGSLCYTKEEVIHSTPLSPEDVEAVLRNAAAIGRPISVTTRNRLAANGIDKDLSDYYRLAGLTLTVADDFDVIRQENVYQIMVGCRKCDHAFLMQGVKSAKVAISWARAVDVIPVSSGKGLSIVKILDYFHLDASSAMAFGDSYNDLEMLQAVGTGVAMGNAAEQLKLIADDVCGPVSEDGIYDYCVKIGLI